MHEIGGFALGRISATVVASGRRYAFMANHRLDRRQIGPDRRRRRATWCKQSYASCGCPIAQNNRHSLIREPRLTDSSAANYSAK